MKCVSDAMQNPENVCRKLGEDGHSKRSLTSKVFSWIESFWSSSTKTKEAQVQAQVQQVSSRLFDTRDAPADFKYKYVSWHHCYLCQL